MNHRLTRAGAGFAAALLLLAAEADAQTLAVGLRPRRLAPQPVGTPVQWTARLYTLGAKALFRFEVRETGGGPWRLVMDYSRTRRIRWTTLEEGSYEIRVTAVDTVTGGSDQAIAPVSFVSRVVGGVPVVSPTGHPLVALYSAPPCETGAVRIRYRPVDGTVWQLTPFQGCRPGRTLNFYVAAMRPDTTYLMGSRWVDGNTTVDGPDLTFRTGTTAFAVPPLTINSPPGAETSSEPLLMTSFLLSASNSFDQVGPVATDLAGNLLWYDPFMLTSESWGSYLARVAPGGSMLLFTGRKQALREIDLAGLVRRETNTEALNRQLVVMGKDEISWLSHDAIRLPNDHTLVLAIVERILTDVQGDGPVDVIGLAILDLDPNFQVTWTWNAFDHLDARRGAILDDVCVRPMCGPLRLAPKANDWLHGNALTHTPDGNLLLSMRHQDWIVKVDYRDGAGDGHVIWRLGAEGDFTVVSDDPWPWFAGQHQPEWRDGRLTVYDNGNTRRVRTGGGNSRGQVFVLDETAMTATLIVNADLGVYAAAWGSSQHLANGGYHFLSGLTPNRVHSTSQEVLPDGRLNYSITGHAGAYRSFRMQDIYTPSP